MGEAKEEPDEKPEEKVEEEEEEEEEDEDPPKVVLTAEEKQMFFIKSSTPDIDAWEMSANFPHFSMPSKEEGFDDIKFSWQKADKSQEYLKNWVIEKKNSTRVE